MISSTWLGGDSDVTATENTTADTSSLYVCGACYVVKDELEDGVNRTRHGLICDSCLESMITCDRCGGLCRSQDVEEFDGESFCQPCARRVLRTCGECDQVMAVDDALHVYGGGVICENCADSGCYRTCDSCATLVSEEDTTYSRRDDSVYCPDCRPCRSSERSGSDYILPYHAGHPNGLKFYGGAGVIHYGAELEVNSRDENEDAEMVMDALGDRVHLEEDGSLINGFEIISQPHTLAAHRGLWPKLFKTGMGELYVEGTNVGMHVHIQKSYLGTMQIARMVHFINRDENAAFVSAVAGRSPTDYCYRTKKKLRHYDVSEAHHYDAVNVKNKTVEIRIFKSVTKEKLFFKNLEFVDALVHFCIDRSVRQLLYTDFCKWLDTRTPKDTFCPCCDKSWKQYPALTEFLAGKGYVVRKDKIAKAPGAKEISACA